MLSAVPQPVTVRVPAKINLHLAVGPLRSDGYHDLVDGLPRGEPVRRGDGRGDRAAGRRGARRGGRRGADRRHEPRLARRRAAWPSTPGRVPDVRVVLRKGIPVAGGMAGGSADAAGALVGLSALWKLDLTRDELARHRRRSSAATSPSPCTAAPRWAPAAASTIVPVLSRHPQHWVIALHRGGLATPAVFRSWTACAATRQPEPRRRTAGRAGARGRRGRRPAPARALAGQRPAGRRGEHAPRSCAGPCGPGSTPARSPGSSPGPGRRARSSASSAEAAIDVAAQLAGVGVCRTVRVVHGPVPGARVVDARRAAARLAAAGPPLAA